MYLPYISCLGPLPHWLNSHNNTEGEGECHDRTHTLAFPVEERFRGWLRVSRALSVEVVLLILTVGPGLSVLSLAILDFFACAPCTLCVLAE